MVILSQGRHLLGGGSQHHLHPRELILDFLLSLLQLSFASTALRLWVDAVFVVILCASSVSQSVKHSGNDVAPTIQVPQG
jgi:hypothetical protein